MANQIGGEDSGDRSAQAEAARVDPGLLQEAVAAPAGGEAEPSRLRHLWGRLETICKRLWDDDAASAVSLQAVIAEFHGEVDRIERLPRAVQGALDEERAAIRDQFVDRIHSLEAQLARASARVGALEKALAQRDDEVARLLGELKEKEERNIEFHEQFLRASARQDELQAKKMEEFYAALKAKKAELEASWEQRAQALEVEYREKMSSLEAKERSLIDELKQRVSQHERLHVQSQRALREAQERLTAEQEDWESRKLAEREALSKRSDELALKAQALEHEYQKKQAQMARIKESMQREISELVRQYQARLKQDEGKAP